MESHFSRAWAIASFLLAACASHSEEPHGTYRGPDNDTPPATTAAKPEADAQDDEPTGKSLYQRHCAGCHNANGDGRGATMLAQGKQARSFAQGGFAFGNTPEAIFKTITSGIPGSSLMQGFKSQMDDDERMLVAKYVLTLTPYKEESKSSDSVMVVGDRAVFAYGKLPPIHEGGAEFPRGLMVGLPGGLSFEYRVDDVRLLAVRRGGFVDRTDWNERGGGYLKPLGEILFEPASDSTSPWLQASIDGAMVPLGLELAASRSIGASTREAQIELIPSRGSPPGLKRVIETAFVPAISEPASFGRRIVLERTPGAPRIEMMIVSGPAGSMTSMNIDSSHAAPPLQRSEGWIVLEHSPGFDCIHVSCPGEVSGVAPVTEDRVAWQIGESIAPGAIAIEIVLVHVNSWDKSLLARLSKELAR